MQTRRAAGLSYNSARRPLLAGEHATYLSSLLGYEAMTWLAHMRMPARRQQAFAENLADLMSKAGASQARHLDSSDITDFAGRQAKKQTVEQNITVVCQVLVLASADAALRDDDQMASPAVRYCATMAGAAESSSVLGFRELEVRPCP